MDTIAIAWIQINLTYKGKEDTELHKKKSLEVDISTGCSGSSAWINSFRWMYWEMVSGYYN